MAVRKWIIALAVAAGCGTTVLLAQAAPPSVATARANPAVWPAAASPTAMTDGGTEAAIDALLGRMTIEQKVGQMIQWALVTSWRMRVGPSSSRDAANRPGMANRLAHTT